MQNKKYTVKTYAWVGGKLDVNLINFGSLSEAKLYLKLNTVSKARIINETGQVVMHVQVPSTPTKTVPSQDFHYG